MTTAGGDPSLGNLGFQIQLVNAPAGARAGLFLGLGCTPGFISACSTFHANPSLGPFVVPIGGVGCNGRAIWQLPLAANASACGLTLCAQDIVICPAAPNPSGIGLSDAIQFNITN